MRPWHAEVLSDGERARHRGLWDGRHHGRPRLPGTGLHASISHSGATVAVAVSSAGAVGVDVQQVVDDSVQELSPLRRMHQRELR
jgi:phosphopantetheinyl transferase